LRRLRLALGATGENEGGEGGSKMEHGGGLGGSHQGGGDDDGRKHAGEGCGGSVAWLTERMNGGGGADNFSVRGGALMVGGW
jgi:hypothetical protein